MKFIQECLRVLKITKKPTKQEYMVVVKVAGLGLIVIGFVGFIVNLLMRFVR